MDNVVAVATCPCGKVASLVSLRFHACRPYDLLGLGLELGLGKPRGKHVLGLPTLVLQVQLRSRGHSVARWLACGLTLAVTRNHCVRSTRTIRASICSTISSCFRVVVVGTNVGYLCTTNLALPSTTGAIAANTSAVVANSAITTNVGRPRALFLPG